MANVEAAMNQAAARFGVGEDGGPHLAQNPYGVRSSREVRADEDGLPVYRLRFRKRS